MAETKTRDTTVAPGRSSRRSSPIEETPEAFGLENVRGFDRPMAAGPRDMLIGRDELGNAIYRTMLGTTYTVRRATPEESETTRTKVENWIDEGAPLPSMEQVVDTAQAIPGAVYESAQNTLEGTATLGEAMSWAPAMGAASLPFDVPEGATRIFGGKNAANAPIPKINFSAVPDLELYSPEVREAVYKLRPNAEWYEYEQYFSNSMDPESAAAAATEAFELRSQADAIAKQNAGWSLGADGLPRFEIDDSRAVYLGHLYPSKEQAVSNFTAKYDPIWKELGDYDISELNKITEDQFNEAVGRVPTDWSYSFQDFKNDLNKIKNSNDGPVPLEAILYHQDLFYQYPELANVEVTLKPMEDGLLGQYNPETRTIELNSNKPDEEIKSTLIHEVQHAVQQIEGFDGGSNQLAAMFQGPVYEANTPEARKAWQQYRIDQTKFEVDQVVPAMRDFMKNAESFAEEALQVINENKLGVVPRFNANRLKDWAAQLKEDNYLLKPSDFHYVLSAVDDLKELSSLVEKHFGDRAPFILGMDSSGTAKSPFNRLYQYQVLGVTPPPEPYFIEPGGDAGVNAYKLYRRNMGETEARNVQTRQDMTREERLANPPRQTEDIPRGFQWANPQRFAEGGLVEDQMKFAFMNEGGMIDDGATVEPTTGNEVPPGSLKEEVADSIDAKLSVGEYVVPADVVQYFGVAHFEKLRQKAKEGLAEMEANGRIGGDPEEDELPFSDEELEAEDMEEDGAQGFAEGGLAWNSPQTTGMTNTGTETVTYVGPDGTKLPVLFMNGQPIQQIPQGYVPEGQAKQQQAAFKSIRPTSNSESGGALNTMQPKAMTEWGVEDFERYANSQGVMDVVSKLPALLGPGGMIMGGLMNKAYQMQGAQALEEIDNRLAMTDLDEQSRTRLEAVKTNLSANTEQEGGLFSGLTGGGGLLEKLFGGGVRTTSETPQQPSFGSLGSSPQQPRTSMAGAPAGSPRPQPRPESSGMTNPAVTRTSSGNTVSRSSSGTKTTSSPGGSREVKSTGESNPGGFSGNSWSTGKAFAEGGFVKRRNKR